VIGGFGRHTRCFFADSFYPLLSTRGQRALPAMGSHPTGVRVSTRPQRGNPAEPLGTCLRAFGAPAIRGASDATGPSPAPAIITQGPRPMAYYNQRRGQTPNRRPWCTCVDRVSASRPWSRRYNIYSTPAPGSHHPSLALPPCSLSAFSILASHLLCRLARPLAKVPWTACSFYRPSDLDPYSPHEYAGPLSPCPVFFLCPSFQRRPQSKPWSPQEKMFPPAPPAKFLAVATSPEGFCCRAPRPAWPSGKPKIGGPQDARPPRPAPPPPKDGSQTISGPPWSETPTNSKYANVKLPQKHRK